MYMLLEFQGLYGHKTKRVVFENAFSVVDSVSLEQLKELTAKRRLIEESINETSRITEATAREMHGGLDSRHEQDLRKLELYLPLLENLIRHVDSVSANSSIDRWISELQIRWTSTLSSSSLFQITGPKFFQIDNLRYELGMTLFIYGVILRKRAFDVSKDLQQSASLLKKAAGIYNYLNAEVLPPLQPVLPPEKPPETTMTVSSVMSLVCLADAQVIAVKKAEEMGISVGALSKLHFGVSQFLGEAIALLQPLKDISGNFVDFISANRILHESRSSRHLAESHKMSEQIGIAIGLLRCTLNNLQKNTPREQSWRTIFRTEISETSELLRKYEEENTYSWRQKIPLDFELPPTEGTKVVSPTLYEPQRWERELAFRI